MGRLTATLLSAGLLAAACTAPVPATATSTSAERILPDDGLLLGLTPFPARPTGDAVVAAFELVNANGSMIAHHFDGGIPWEHLLYGDPIPDGLADELAGRRSASHDQVVYVATAISNFERDNIPSGFNGSPRPAELEGAGPGSPEVGAALTAWIDLLVAELDPDYLNVAIELDLAVAKQPNHRDDLIALYKKLYEHAKAAYPDVVVFASFQAEIGDPSVVAEVADSTDLIAVSAYPYFDADAIPGSDYFDRFFEFGLDVAIAETGYPAGAANTPRGQMTSTPERQAEYVGWLLDQACDREMPFVIWFLPTDIDMPAWGYPPGLAEVAGIFATNGLYTADGESRPASDRWRAATRDDCGP